MYTRAGSTDPFCIAVSTAAASARTRESMSAAGAPAGAITCHPASRVQFCHCTASPASSSAIAGTLVCASSGHQRIRLIVAQACTNSFSQFLDVIRLLERRHGENVAIVLFQVDLQLFGQLRELGRIFEVLLVFR